MAETQGGQHRWLRGISLTLTAHNIADLDRVRKSYGMSRSELTRMLVDDYLPSLAEKLRKRGRKGG